MSVMPAYIVAAAIMLAPISQWSAEVGSTYSRDEAPVGRDIATLTSLIPANMSATVFVPNLSKLGQQLLSTKLMGNQNKNPYKSFMASLEIVDGIDDLGAGAIGIMGGTSTVDVWENMALWLPATNPAAVLTFMQPIQISAGLYRVTIAGHPSFAAEHGGFLLLSPRLEVIDACLNSPEPIKQRLSAHQQRTLDDADLALVVSSVNTQFPKSDDVQTHSKWLAAWPGMAALQFAMSPSTSAPQLPMWSLSIKPNGLEMSMIGHGRRDRGKDQASTATLRSNKVRGTDLLLALPSESVVAAVGFEPNSAMLASSGFIDLLLDYIKQRNIVSAQSISELLRTLRRSISRASVGSIAVQSSGNNFNTCRSTLILKTDTQQTNVEASIIRAEFQSIVSQFKRGFFVDPLWQGFANRLQIIPMASSYQGVQIDHLSVDGISDNKSTGTSQFANFISADGVIARMAVIDNRAFVLVVGGSEQGIHDVIKRWRGHQTPLLSNSTIVSYAATRRSPVSAEGYISSNGLRWLAGFLDKKKNNSASASDTTEEKWVTFSSINVELGVERFNMFLPYSWLDQFLRQNVKRK